MPTPTYEAVWMGVGFLGQGIFTARFVVQWAASERKRESVVPEAFWWISLAGGLTLLAYTVHKRDLPLSLGQAMGLFVYVRNLMLSARSRRRSAKRRVRVEAAAAIARADQADHPAPMSRRADPSARAGVNPGATPGLPETHPALPRVEEPLRHAL